MNSSTAADEIEQLHLAVFVSLDPDTERHHISLANRPCFVTPCGANVGGNRCDVGVGELDLSTTASRSLLARSFR
jgi:hypothetical protein